MYLIKYIINSFIFSRRFLMIKFLGCMSGIICLIILSLNFLSYLLQDIYFSLNNKKIKKSINSILPIFFKYSRIFNIICILSLLIHISCFFININHFCFIIFMLILLSILILFNFSFLSKQLSNVLNSLKKLASYLIIIFILYHILL